MTYISKHTYSVWDIHTFIIYISWIYIYYILYIYYNIIDNIYSKIVFVKIININELYMYICNTVLHIYK